MKQFARHIAAPGHHPGPRRLVFTAFLLIDCICMCACHTTDTGTVSPRNQGKGELQLSSHPGKTTYHIDGPRVKSVDVYDLGSYTNTAFREADFPGGRIIE